MMIFDDMEDLEEWLAPLDWESFWKDTAGFELVLQPRESCERQIATGGIDEKTVLYVLKGMARLELIERFHLKPRDVMPWYSLH
jgi:hypothetical protein